MLLDINKSLGLPEEEEDAEEEEEQGEEVSKETEKPSEPSKPKIDHSIPVRERIKDEHDKLTFEANVFGSMERYAAKILCELLFVEFDNHPEREGEWDMNEWTVTDFLKAFSDKARAMTSAHGGQALFAGRTEDPNDPTMALLREIIETKNEPKKTAPTHTASAPKSSKASNKKSASQPHAEQMKLDFGSLL